ncbi:MAG UNVERIFIED_CONTAM: hypothetical protein LVQ98_04345 [Rickettsiaceae bacterium]
MDQRQKLADFAKEYELIRLIFRYRKTIDVIHEREKPYIIFDDVKVEIDAILLSPI